MDRFVTEHTPKADIQRFPDNAAAIAAFQSGRVDAVCLFHPPLLAARQKLGKGKLVVPTPAQSQASSTAAAQGRPEFVAWVDKQLAEYYKSGQTQKWYEQALNDFGLDPKLAPPIMKEMIKYRVSERSVRRSAHDTSSSAMTYQWDFTPVLANAALLAQGLVNTLKITGTALACGLVLGLALAADAAVAEPAWPRGRPASSSRCSAPRRRWSSSSGSSSPCR